MSDRATMPADYDLDMTRWEPGDMLTEIPGQNEDDGRVCPDEACPYCGESQIDNLVWITNETVQCQTCGTKYTLL